MVQTQDFVKRWCCICGKCFDSRNLPLLNVEPAFCSDSCWINGLEQSRHLAKWHEQAKKNDMAAAILSYA